jgi:hypothetical protein
VNSRDESPMIKALAGFATFERHLIKARPFVPGSLAV